MWQIHAVVYDNDPDLAYRKGGVIEALEQAKRQGKVRYVGFSGHKDPRIHLRMLELGYAWDSVQFPVNAFDAQFRSFQQAVLPEAVRRGIAVLGMKPFNGRGAPFHHGDVKLTPQQALRYAMSVPGVTTTITGMESVDVLRQNVAIARAFAPMSAAEMQQVVARGGAAGGRRPLRDVQDVACVRRRRDPSDARAAAYGSERVMAVPHRTLKGASVSVIGIGGSSLGDVQDESEALRIVSEALDAGINFFDNAWEYHDGMSEERMGRALKGKRDRAFLMTKVCSHGRGRQTAMMQLEDSLRRVHRPQGSRHPSQDAVAPLSVRHGADAAQPARQELSQLSSARAPRSAASGHRRDRDEVDGRRRRAGQARRRDAAGAVALRDERAGNSHHRQRDRVVRVFRQNLAVAQASTPMGAADMLALENRVRMIAGDGRLEHYKATTIYDAAVGREQHGFPSARELPA